MYRFVCSIVCSAESLVIFFNSDRVSRKSISKSRIVDWYYKASRDNLSFCCLRSSICSPKRVISSFKYVWQYYYDRFHPRVSTRFMTFNFRFKLNFYSRSTHFFIFNYATAWSLPSAICLHWQVPRIQLRSEKIACSIVWVERFT